MALASIDDVAVALGRPISSSAEEDQIEYWLNGAELVIRKKLGDVALLDQDMLRYVETEAIAAKVERQGSRESSISIAVDDATVTRRYENGVTTQDITDEWWNLLSPTVDARTGSIRPSFDTDAAWWAAKNPAAEVCGDAGPLPFGDWDSTP